MPISWSTVETVSGDLIPTTLQTSVTYDGVTFTFDKAMPVGEFVTGKPFVVSSEAFEITSISPAAADINTDGYVGNGAMKDPFITSAIGGNNYAVSVTPAQGFDQYLSADPNGTSFASTLTPYSSGLNIDPGNTGSPINITLGEEATIVKSVRNSTVLKPDEWDVFEKYAPLTILSEAPPVGCLMPTMTGTTKRLYSVNDIDLTVFRSITLPASFTDTLAQIEAKIPEFSGDFGANGELLRRFRLDANLGTTASNYSGDISQIYSKACIVLHSDAYTDDQKKNLLYKLVEWGIQLEGCYDRGWRGLGDWREGAGQAGAFSPFMFISSFALQSTTMLAKIQSVNLPFNSKRWTTSEFLNIVPGANSGNLAQPFIEENIGVPMSSSTNDTGSQWASRYGPIISYIAAWEGAAIIMLRNGPSGETGFSARNDGPFNATNDKSAIWAYNDRSFTINPYPSTSWNPQPVWYDLWEQIQGLGIYTPWTGVPEQLHVANANLEGENGDRITSTADGYSWDVSDHDYATETVTSVDFHYSLDGVQYVENIGAGATGSVSGLLRGVNHHIGLRFVSASGAGPWSQNWPLTESGGWADTDRNSFPTTGTPTAAIPEFTTNPVIHYKRSPQWPVFPGNWIPASGTLDADAVELACGLGYVSGQAEPSFTFQWKRGGLDISGATSQTYTRVPADAGEVITCTVTPSNSAGTGTPVTTAGVTAPAITTLPAGTLIDTDFRGAFAIDYADEISSIVASGCNLIHAPVAFPIDLGENFGSMFWDKTAGNPQGYFDISRSAETATTYDVSGQLAIDGSAITDRANIVFTIEEIGGSILFTETVLGADVVAAVADGYHLLRNFTGAITTASITDLRVKMTWLNGTGGTGGVDMHLTQLSIVAQ